MLDEVLRRNDDLFASWDATGRMWLTTYEGGGRICLPPQTAMLVHAFDGRRTVEQILTALVPAGDARRQTVELIGRLHKFFRSKILNVKADPF